MADRPISTQKPGRPTPPPKCTHDPSDRPKGTPAEPIAKPTSNARIFNDLAEQFILLLNGSRPTQRPADPETILTGRPVKTGGPDRVHGERPTPAPRPTPVAPEPTSGVSSRPGRPVDPDHGHGSRDTTGLFGSTFDPILANLALAAGTTVAALKAYFSAKSAVTVQGGALLQTLKSATPTGGGFFPMLILMVKPPDCYFQDSGPMGPST